MFILMLSDHVHTAVPHHAHRLPATENSRVEDFSNFIHSLYLLWGGIPRRFNDREVTFCGTKLPKGTNFMLLLKYIGNQTIAPSKDVPIGLNGEVPSEFYPTRYLVKDPDTGCLSTKTPSTEAGGFMVFGHGMHSCPGRTYSEAFSYLLLASLLQTFNVELAPNHPHTESSELESSLHHVVECYDHSENLCCWWNCRYRPLFVVHKDEEHNDAFKYYSSTHV
jgi:hypothetical protein